MVDFDQDVRGLSPNPSSGSGDGSKHAPYRPGGADESPGAGSDLPENQYAVLARTIENQIIPRLMLAHRLDGPAREQVKSTTQAGPSKAVVAFSKLVRAQDSKTLLAHATSLLNNGLPLNSLLLNLLAPCARYLGELWHEDECSFVDVTLALCKLQYLLREVGDGGVDAEQSRNARFKVLLAAVPGEQHSFGISMVEGFFKRSGWNVRSMPMPGAEDIADAVRQERFAVAGLSMSGSSFAPKLPALIARLRKVSRNPSLVVLVGGNYFNERPDQAIAVGADATASDALHAVAQTAHAVNGITRN